MKKIQLALVFAFIGIGCFMVKQPHHIIAALPCYGDADALGADDDANSRFNYELMMLRDPATGKIPAHMRERELDFAATLPTDLAQANERNTSLAWQPRGPWNVGGRTRALAIDVSNENILLAGSCSGGMWRSTDMGTTWQMTTTVNNYNKAISCIAQDTRRGHSNVWYYGTGEAVGASASETGAYYLGSGIYKSTDGGLTWNVLPSTTTSNVTAFSTWGELTWNIVTNPADTVHDVVYAATYGAIYKSTDGGTTWNSVLGSFGSSYYTDVAISKSGVVYATLSSDGGSRGVYRSTDGVTFTNITPDSFPGVFNRVKIGISPSDENQVYFLGNTPGYGMPDTNYLGQVEWNSLWKYRYRSGNGSGDTGGVWQNLSANMPSSGGLFDKFTSQGSYDLVVKVKPNDTNVVFIGGTNLYRSTSGFSDAAHTSFIGGYQEYATLPVVNLYIDHHPDQHELVFLPGNPNKMISSNDGGVFYADDNSGPYVYWRPLNHGYVTTMFYTCAIDHASANSIVIGGAQDNGSWYTNSTSYTDPWVTPRGGDGSYCAIADSGKAYYFSIQSGKMMRAKLNSAGGVDSFARIDPIGGHGYQFVNPYTLDPNNNNLMYLAAGKALWRNNNLSGIPYAGNWDSISTNWQRIVDSTTTGTASVTAVTAAKTPANRVYFGTNQRSVYRVDSANAASPHVRNITGTIFPGAINSAAPYVSCIAVDPQNADHVMVAYANYGIYSLFYSPDGGTTWKKVAGNLEQNKTTGTGDGPSLRWASILPVSDGTVYLVGTSVGLFATTQLNDTNTVWVQQGTNSIGSAVVDMIDYRSTDGTVVVATHSNGIFSSAITQVGNITGVAPVAANKNFNLLAYPNPFGSETTIQFDLSDNSNVNISVFDQMGRLVQTIVNEPVQPGQKKYIFRANNLSSGMYYCVLRAGSTMETRPLILVR